MPETYHLGSQINLKLVTIYFRHNFKSQTVLETTESIKKQSGDKHA